MTVQLSLPERFAGAMATIGTFETHPVIAVAVSGGSDSMALLWLAKDWAEAHGGCVIGLTVDHGLRDESAAEAQQVRQWLSEKNIEHHIIYWQGDKSHANLQAHARQARYGLMEQWCRHHHILHLLLAHHQDDQAETFLMRLERGSGIDGLSGMALAVPYHSIRLLRPLLSISKNALRHYLVERNLGWCEDASNTHPKYSRNRLRQSLALEDILLTTRLAATADHLGRARASLERTIAALMVKAVRLHPEGYATIDVTPLKEAAEEEGLQLLAAVLKTVGGHPYKPRFQSLSRLYDQIFHPPLAQATLWGCRIISQQNHLLILREVAAIEEDLPLLPHVPCQWDSRFRCELNISLSLRVGALSREAWRQLVKESPELAKIQLPKAVIITLPSVKTLDSVVAIPHIGYYREGITAGTIACRFEPVSPLTSPTFRYNRMS